MAQKVLRDVEPPPPECEHCGGPSAGRYCCDDCRLADKTGTGPMAHPCCG